MQTSLFMVVEFPATELPLTGFTARHPEVTIDLISEPPVDRDGERVHPSVALIKGAPPAVLDGLIAQLATVYSPIHVIERDDLRHHWLARMEIKESAFTNPGARRLVQFRHRYGVPWTHLEGGVLHMRARVEDQERGEFLADQVRRYLAEEGAEAQVELQEISSRDYSVWEDLVQHTLGMAP